MNNSIKVIVLVGVFILGFFSQKVFDIFNQNVVTQQKEKQVLYWVAPMDANYRRDKAGKSPMGMDLVPVYAGGDDAVVSISAAVENNLGLRSKKVLYKSLQQQIITVGSIEFSDDEISHIHTRTEGWIEKLHVNSIGSKVHKGEVLFELYSPELVNAQEEYLSVLKSDNARLLRAAKRRLLLLDFTEKQIKQLQKTKMVKRTVGIVAPHDGVVSELAVREGMFIKPDKKIMAVGNLHQVWVVAEVFERQSAWLAVGQKVEMKVSSFANKTWQGTVQYIYPEYDKKSRTAKVRLRFNNEDLLLKPNMVAQLTIQAGSDELRLLVPVEAVIHTQGRQRIVKKMSEGKYRSVWITTGLQSNGFTEVFSGLDEGDDVVVSAQFLIDSESNIDAELNRLQGAHHDQ